MADDTRDRTSSVQQTEASENVDGQQRRPRRSRPDGFPESQASKMWKTLGNPDQPINEMPGGMVNTAGGRPREVTWRDAFNFDIFNSETRPAYHKQPCARDALLVGLGSGGAVGGMRFILGGETNMKSVMGPQLTFFPHRFLKQVPDKLRSWYMGCHKHGNVLLVPATQKGRSKRDSSCNGWNENASRETGKRKGCCRSRRERETKAGAACPRREEEE